MHRPPPASLRLRRKLLIAATFGALASASSAHAGTVETFFQNADLGNGANYTPAGVPTNTTDIGFTGSFPAANATLTYTAAANFMAESLNSTDTKGFKIVPSSNATLTLGNPTAQNDAFTGANAADLIYLGSTSGGLTLGTTALLSLATGGNFDVATGTTLLINSVITGSSALAITGGGTVSLTGANQTSLTSAITVQNGTLSLAGGSATSSDSFGAGTITLGGGTSAASSTASAAVLGGGGQTFTNNIALSQFTTGTLTLGSFVGSGTPSTFNGTISGTNNLTLSAGGTTAGPVTLSGPVNISGTITNAGPGAASMTVSSVIASTVTQVTQNSTTSTLNLNNTGNAFGNLSVTAGTVAYNLSTNTGTITSPTSVGTAFGTGAVTLNGGQLSLVVGAAGNGNTSVTQVANNVILGSNGGTLNLASKSAGATGILSGNISGSGPLTLSSLGTQTFTGTNTYTGTTAVSSGTLLVNGTHTGGGAYTVTGSTLGGTGSINTGANAINIGNGTLGGTITGGAVGTVGMLTLTTTGGVIFNGASGSGNLATYQADVNASGTDELVISGALNLSGTSDQLAINNIATLAPGTYPLATYSSLSGTFDNVTGLSAGESIVYNANGTELDLVIAAVPEPGATGVIVGSLGLLLAGRARLRQRCGQRAI